MDFPADVFSNSYALEGFADVAYAICVPAKVNNVGTSDASRVEQEASEFKGTERLRSAESELRRARVLVALDITRRELYTFYRREDLERDAKSLVNLVVNILRKNECQMSSKHAIKTADMLRPENSLVHRLFIYAVLCMMKSGIQEGQNHVPLGLNTFLVRYLRGLEKEFITRQNFGEVWRFVGLNAQLLPNGQVIAIRYQANALFKQLSTFPRDEKSGPFFRKPSKVLLAVTGQYARYMGGYIGKLPHLRNDTLMATSTSVHSQEVALQMRRQEIWKFSLGRWLQENELDVSVDEDDWIEVELPFSETDAESSISPSGLSQSSRISWRSIFWPTSLCYINIMDLRPAGGTESPSLVIEDPLQFVEDLVASAADRKADTQKREQEVERSRSTHRVDDHDISGQQTVHVDPGQAFRRVAAIEGQAAAAIYPTPPEGTLSQITPGVFSIDGLATTPAEGVVAGHVHSTGNTIELLNLGGVQVAIGSGLYDEDLFEDISGEKFGEADMAEEPNWDYFDEPDADMVEQADPMEIDIPETEPIASNDSRNLNPEQTEDPNDKIRDIVPAKQVEGDPDEQRRSHISEDNKDMQPTASGVVERPSKAPAGIGTKRASRKIQPLSPLEVRKRLFSDIVNLEPFDLGQARESLPSRRALLQHHFDSIFFQPELKAADNRYCANGFFYYEVEKESELLKANSTDHYMKIPRIGTPTKDQSSVVPDTPGGPELRDSSPSDEDTDFDSSDFFSEGNKQASPGGSIGDDAGSLALSPKPADEAVDSKTENKLREEAFYILDLLRPEIDEISFWRSHQPLKRKIDAEIPMTPDKVVTVAQVVVDQASQTFFQYSCFDSATSTSDSRNVDLLKALQLIYGEAKELTLGRIAEITANTQDAAEGNWLAASSFPFIRLGRADTKIDAIPTIQPFWETLGLQPAGSKKDIKAVCIHPVGKHIEESSSAFLQRLGELYENCNLGKHTIGLLDDYATHGLIQWEVERASPMHVLLRVCQRLASSLVNLPPLAENFVVYVINPFDNGQAIADICNAFVSLFTAYAKACWKVKGMDLILQIIPMSFIASSDTVVIPLQADYLSLALEVYNRCPPLSSDGEVAESAAAVTLAKPIPKKIIFDLAADATSPLSKDGEVLHLAYSQSMDLRWLTACWTDNLGNIAFTMTYCLCHEGSSLSRPRSEIIKEMWEISQDIMTKNRGKWRLLVAHDGPIGPDEISEWSFSANPSTSTQTTSQCSLVILTFDERPSIQFSPPTPSRKPQLPSAVALATGKYGTPVSTPTASTMISSPEQFTASTPMPPTPGASGLLTAPTPPDQSSQSQAHGFDMTNDPDAILVDPTDECWSLLLPFGLNNSPSPLESRPALSSGFLLKRRGPLDSDGIVALGVNLISTSADMMDADRKALLCDVIGQWRGLYTLARTKSLGGVGAVLPWHVRTAVLGCRAASEVL